MKSIINNYSYFQSKSVSFVDPLIGSVIIHGITDKRPKAYAGEIIPCPWDKPKNILLRKGSAFLTINDFPALTPGSIEDRPQKKILGGFYEISYARGENLIVIYSDRHNAHWLTLTDKEKFDVVSLWTDSTERAKKFKNCEFVQIFENDGPANTMHHPHGQQYNLADIPPAITNEIERCKNFFRKTSKNLLHEIYKTESAYKKRLVSKNDSFIAFCPPGARWPYQVRILPKKHRLWLTEFSPEEEKDLANIITDIRLAYKKVFRFNYQPTVMTTIEQAPFDKNSEYYRKIYGFRVEFYNTALTPKAEKLMFSIENSTGLIPYSDTAEDIAKQLRQKIK